MPISQFILAYCYSRDPLQSTDSCMKLHNQRSILKSYDLTHKKVEFVLKSELVKDCVNFLGFPQTGGSRLFFHVTAISRSFCFGHLDGERAWVEDLGMILKPELEEVSISSVHIPWAKKNAQKCNYPLFLQKGREIGDHVATCFYTLKFVNL